MSAEEILKRRKLAAKGLNPAPRGKPIDPMEDPIDEVIDPPRNPGGTAGKDRRRRRGRPRGAQKRLSFCDR